MKPEVLAPAGSREALEAAVRSGADAVYLGMGGFNARRGASNFDGDDYISAVEYCHIRGVRVYLTLNTLVSDAELESALDCVALACKAGTDAVIVQDLGLARLMRESAPGLRLHASTQLSVHSESALERLAEAGYPNGFDMSIAVISSYQPHMDTAEVVVEQLRAIGVNAEVVPMDEATWADQVYKNRQFQATINGLAAKNTTASDMLARFVSTNGKNFVNYNNSEYDALYAQAQACTDDAQQTAIYKQLETMLTETAANLYLQDLANLVAIRSDLTGYQFYPIYAMDFSTVAYSK